MTNDEHQKKAYELANAYEAVFGQEGKRNDHQKKVWDDLTVRTGFMAKLVRCDANGRVDLNQTLVLEGHREIFLLIMEQLERAKNGLEQGKITVEKTK